MARRSASHFAAALALALATASCSLVLGLRDIDEGPALALGDGGDARRARDADTPPADADTDAGADARARGVCDGYPAALLCDDFESGQASPRWRTEFQGGAGSVKPRPMASDAGPIPNLRDFVVGFVTLPDVGKAALAFDVPGGKRSLRFALWVPSKPYPDGCPIGGFVDATGNGVRLELVSRGTQGDRALVVRDTVADAGVADLGYVPFGVWTCIELEIDGVGNARAWQHQSLATGMFSASTAAAPLAAEIGVTWTFGASTSSLNMHYDDVVVSTGAVGCD